MRLSKRIIAVILTVLLMFSTLSAAVIGTSAKGDPEKEVSSLTFAAMSDIHYYPQSYTGNKCEAWQEFSNLASKEYNESEALTKAALDSIAARAEENGTKYLLIPGDLTKDSEYQAHVELAAVLEQFEKETGIQVIVTAGNHDINNNSACTFENGVKEPARCITQAEFKEVYKNLGYDLAFEKYNPPAGETACGLSYAVDLDDNYRLIVVDSNKYAPDVPQKQQTDGAITDDAMAWIKSLAEDAEKQGKTPMVMMHHSLAPHMKLEPSVTFAFCVDDYMNVAEQFADSGIHFGFTGHLHTNDIASVTSDEGNTLYDCEVGSITGFPNQFREMTIKTFGDGESDMSYNLVDVDYAHEITVDGTTYAKPFSKASFAINYGGRFNENGAPDAEEFFMGIINNFLLPYVSQINDAGGISPFLKTMGIDIEALLGGFLEPYIGDGIGVGGINIFSVKNIMWFLDDLLDQVEELYINNPQKLTEFLRSVVHRLVEFKVSDVPCTKFIEKYNFGDASKPGTLGDLILSGMTYWYSGNEDSSDDAFVCDVLKGFEEGDLAEKLVDELIDIILNDIVNDAILSKIEIRLGKLFDNPNTKYSSLLGCSVDYFTKTILKGDITYKNLVDTIFALNVLPYSSLQNVIDSLTADYLDGSQMEGIGAEVAYCLTDFVTDENPKHLGDDKVVYSSDRVIPEATTENYRLPTMISVTLGEDSTSANINWFSKSTVTGEDIEIYKADEFSAFTGTPTSDKDADFTIETKTETVDRSYYGIDFGVIGLFSYTFKLNKHTVTISNLEKGAKYYYRIGDAEKGWWSKTGTVETADGSDNVTFLHMSDAQSQNKAQYNRSWANTVNKAFSLYPDAKFIVNTGDLVDHGNNSFQWQWMFDTASDNLVNTYLMPVTGNHEAKTDNATVNNFALSNLPEQDTASGVYYSFDYNNVHVMVLNTNDLNEDNTLSDKQIEWLKNDASSSDAQWKIVAFHKALYSNGSHYDDKDVCAMRDQLSVLMPQLGIDIVLQGHDHVYMRTYAMDSNKVTDTERVYLTKNGHQYKTDVMPTGTSYIISGTSGVKTYVERDVSVTDEYFPRAEVVKHIKAQTFSAIQIEGGVLYFDAYKVDGNKTERIDSFAIQKDTTQGNVTGDCEDVSAEKQNQIPSENKGFIEQILDFIIKILNFIAKVSNIIAVLFE